ARYAVNYRLTIAARGPPSSIEYVCRDVVWWPGPMQILGIYLYVTAVGFVAAGVLASFVQLVSGEPMRFRLGASPQSILASIGGLLLLVLAGPAVLMRSAWRGLQARPKVWFGISAA